MYRILSFTLLTGVFWFHSIITSAQNTGTPDYKLISTLSGEAGNYFEGFSRKISGEDIEYTSVRNDVSKGFLTRCTTGNMAIEWESQAVPANYTGKDISFIWASSFDFHGGNMPFDVSVNGQLRFTFSELNNKNWIVKNADGSQLSFITVKTDQHGDCHGYTKMKIPASWIVPGKPIVIKIAGRALKANTWYMAFQCSDVVSYLKGAAANEWWFELRAKKQENNLIIGNILAPLQYAGKQLKYETGGRQGVLTFSNEKEEAVASVEFQSSAQAVNFRLLDEQGQVLFNLPELFSDKEEQVLKKDALITITGKVSGENATVKIISHYQPGLTTTLETLVSNQGTADRMLLMNSSHQDIAWMDYPGSCIIQRDTMLLTPLLNAAKHDPSYRFDIEDALMIREFIGRHPENKSVLGEMLKDGRISCGATYIQPYEEMYSGEALVRQFYLGKKWLKKEFGYESLIYWNMDVPGRTPQMPQLMKRSGVPYLLLSRQSKDVFNWYSPDGSSVTCYSPGHYGSDYPNLNKGFADAASYLANLGSEWNKKFSFKPGEPAIIPVLSDWDMSPAKDYSGLISQWNSLGRLQKDDGSDSILNLPDITLSSMPGFMDAFVKSATGLKSIKGERPDVWMYIHGPAHYESIKDSRQGDIMMTIAEKFSTINCLLEGSFVNYPKERLDKAWEAKIYPDHGWGGKNGDITDAVFAAKYRCALTEASQVTEDALRAISGKIKTETRKGEPVIVFNSLSRDRTNPVTFRVSFEEGVSRGINIQDAGGMKIPAQLSSISSYKDGSILSAECTLIAPEIPAIGYSTLYYYPSTLPVEEIAATEVATYESKYYKLEFGKGGLKQLFDKELGKNLLDTKSFLGGEIFTMQSVGEDAGEWADMQHPTMEGFDRTGNYNAVWELVEDGPVYAAFRMQSPVRNAKTEERLTVYKQLKRIDIEVKILNFDGTMFREFRMAWPLAMQEGQVAYEVPFGVVEVGKDEMEGAAGERYIKAAKDIHPRSVENWISASGNGIGVTLGTGVVVNDYLNPTDTSDRQTILQPLLFASRRSCHGEGNTYPQSGDHTFTFSLTSHQPGWQNGRLTGKEVNEPLITVVNPPVIVKPSLPERLSFVRTDNPSVVISTIKKAEDDDEVIIRTYENEGKNASFELSTIFTCQSARETNLIEEPLTESQTLTEPLKLEAGKYSVHTYRFSFGRAKKSKGAR